MEKAIWTPQILHLPPPSLHSIHTFLHLFIQLHPRIHTDLRAPTTSCMPHSPALHTTISTSLLLTFCLSAPTPQCPPPPFMPLSLLQRLSLFPVFPSLLSFSPFYYSISSLSPFTCHCLSCHLIVSLLQLSIHSSFLSPHSFPLSVCVCVCQHLSGDRVYWGNAFITAASLGLNPGFELLSNENGITSDNTHRVTQMHPSTHTKQHSDTYSNCACYNKNLCTSMQPKHSFYCIASF